MKGRTIFKTLKPYYFFILLALILFHIINNFVILKNDQSYPYHNVGRLVKNSQTVYNFIKGEFTVEPFKDFKYPLFFFVVPSFFYFIFGFSLFVATMTNSLFFPILILSVYGIGRKLHSKKSGLLAAFIVSFFPTFFGFSRVYTLDFALASIISMCIYCLLKTEYFTNKKFSLFFGLSMGLAAAIKQSFFIYIIGPFLLYLYHSFFFKHILNDKKSIIEKIKNVLLSFVISFFFALIWYVPALGSIISLTQFAILVGQDKSGVFGIPNVLFYLKLMAGTQILIFFFFLLVFAIFFFMFLSKRKNFLLLLWFFIPLIFYTFFLPFNQSGRFMLPVLPAAALMIAISILSIGSDIIKKMMVILIIFISFGQFFLISYFPEDYLIINKINHKFGLDQHPNIYFMPEKYGLFPPYTADAGLFHSIRYDWGIDKIINIINESLGNNQTKVVQVETFNQIVSMPLQYFFEINGYNNVKIKDSERTPPDEPFGNPDFVILTNMSKMSDVTGGDCLVNINAAIKKFEGRTDYRMVTNLTLPDNTLMYVYVLSKPIK